MVDKLDALKKTQVSPKAEENKSQEHRKITIEEIAEAMEKVRTDPDSTLVDEMLS